VQEKAVTAEKLRHVEHFVTQIPGMIQRPVDLALNDVTNRKTLCAISSTFAILPIARNGQLRRKLFPFLLYEYRADTATREIRMTAFEGCPGSRMQDFRSVATESAAPTGAGSSYSRGG
jgi:hypothetical protein